MSGNLQLVSSADVAGDSKTPSVLKAEFQKPAKGISKLAVLDNEAGDKAVLEQLRQVIREAGLDVNKVSEIVVTSFENPSPRGDMFLLGESTVIFGKGDKVEAKVEVKIGQFQALDFLRDEGAKQNILVTQDSYSFHKEKEEHYLSSTSQWTDEKGKLLLTRNHNNRGWRL